MKRATRPATNSFQDGDANVYLDALLWLTPENPFTVDEDGRTQVSYSFGGSVGYDIRDSGSSVDYLTASAWTSVEQAAAHQALLAWTSVANIDLVAPHVESATFKLLTATDAQMSAYFSGERGILGFSTLPNDYSAYPYGPPGSGEVDYTPGYSVFNKQGDGWTAAGLKEGGYGYLTMVHEIGHLFGLDHPFYEGGYNYETKTGEPHFHGATGPYKTGVNGLNQGIFTSMSYNDGWSGQPSRSLDYGWQKGPMAFDIAAMQELYGANADYRTGNDVYTLPKANVAGTGWLSIWDAGGEDTIVAPDGAGSATIDLRDAPLAGPNAGGYVSWVGGVAGGFTIASGDLLEPGRAAIENAIGAAGNDTITGNEFVNRLTGGGGNDTIKGLAGDDILSGGLGRDLLSGGEGCDVFVFAFAAESAAGSKRDAIQDFQDGLDHIDFAAFDANSRTPGTQHFDFIGGAGFHGTAGELRFASGILAGDLNGDRCADFEVSVAGVSTLDLGDFYLA